MACLLVDTRPSDRGIEWVTHVAVAATSALKSEVDTDKAAAMNALALCVIHMKAVELTALMWSFARTGALAQLFQLSQGTASGSTLVSTMHAKPDLPTDTLNV